MFFLLFFTRWFILFLFNLFFVGSFSFWCRGWSGILFIFSAWMRSLACLLPSSGSTPAVFSISTMGEVFMAPRIVLKPIFWTLSILLVCVLVAVAQVPDPYSRDGRTAPMQTVFRILELAPQCVPDSFFRTASFLMPFFSMSSMCGFHKSRVSSFTPRRWESLLGVASCLQALWRLFLWRWRGRKLWPESSLHWSEDPSHLSTALPCSQLLWFCKQKMLCIQMHSTQQDHRHVHISELPPNCPYLFPCWGKTFFMPSSACLFEPLSGKICFDFVVGSYVIICRVGFYLLSESAGSTTMELLQLCIPAWDVVSPRSSGNCFFGSAEDGSCE